MAKGKYRQKREEEQAVLKAQRKGAAWATVKKYLNRYFIDAMGSMALGLFASLLIGTIFDTVAKYTGLEFLSVIAAYAKSATGMALGVAISYRLGAHPLVMFSCAAVGAMSNAMGAIMNGGTITAWAVTAGTGEGIFYSAGPAGAFFAVIIASEIGMLVSKKTKVDILVTPVVTLLVGFGASWLLCPVVSYIMYYLGVFIATATTFQPLLMGIVISVVVGVVLTLPISSAAICAMIFSASALEAATANGTAEGLLLAGGAAVAGCCAQMVGFAVSSFRENKWGGIISQGLGTSMLQMGNICRKPIIWLPPTLASAITGPISTMVFKLECSGVSAGMGTCGLVGPIGVISQMEHTPTMWIGVVLCCLVLPAVLSLAFSEIMRRLGWISQGDMKLEN
ncbi:MAG: PTS sugar transporter subunit IIC [Ruminococcaceae bacterium]|nr:PTS sugar transporter subunit IIC [Oscillospiraceae bacterium]